LKTSKKGTSVFLVLVPHRDVRQILRDYTFSLIKAGLKGVYNFPWVSPLAELSAPFTEAELKICARTLKENTTEGKITSGEGDCVSFSVNESKKILFGPRLDIKINHSEKIISVFSPPVIGAFFKPEEGKINFTVSQPPPVSFRAAAVANMYWKTLNLSGEEGYKWKIGKLFWLPKT
jgi:hypothetical protein